MGTTETENTTNPVDTISYGVGTDVGRRREENQDSFGVINKDKLKFYIVADGMGGTKGGAVASSLAVKTVEQNLAAYDSVSVQDIAKALSGANSEIFKKGAEEEGLAGMGTTFVGLAFFDTSMIVVNVGDSRAYRIRGENITQLTDDHTLVNDLLRNGAITKEQAENHPVAHMLTRSLGPCADVDIDAFMVEDGPAADDRYLLCSDGLYNVVSTQEILTIVKNKSIDEAVAELINLANDRGGPDNITVLLIHVGSEFPKKASDFKEVSYPLYVPKNLPRTDAYDIRATRDQYKSVKIKREPDDAEVRLNSAPNSKLASNIAIPSQVKPSPLVHLKWAGLMVLGLVMGFILSETTSFLKNKNQPEIRTVSINPLATEIAKTPVLDYAVLKPEMELSFFHSERISGVRTSRDISDAIASKNGLTPDQVESVIERRKTIRNILNSIKSQLAMLDAPNTVQLGERKKALEEEISKQQSDQSKVNDELTALSKELVSWIERKQKLSTTDPVNMASELAFASTFVKEKKELFEKATWAYLKEVEVWRFSPSDKSLTQKISELGKAREQRRLELADAVTKVVEQEKERAERKVSEASTRIKSLETTVSELKGELAFVDIVSSADENAKKTYRQDLEKRREIAQSELDEIGSMVP